MDKTITCLVVTGQAESISPDVFCLLFQFLKDNKRGREINSVHMCVKSESSERALSIVDTVSTVLTTLSNDSELFDCENVVPKLKKQGTIHLFLWQIT